MYIKQSENDESYQIGTTTFGQIADARNIYLNKNKFSHFHFESVVDHRQKSPFIAFIICNGNLCFGNHASSNMQQHNCRTLTLAFFELRIQVAESAQHLPW